MNAQGSLFDAPATQGAHRKKDPRTSIDAARSCDTQRQRDQILRLLDSTISGWTADELGAAMRPPVHRSTVASRLAQLRGDGLVEPWGFRPNQGGRNVQLWHRLHLRTVDVHVTGERL